MRGKRNFHLLSQPEVIIIPMIDIMLFLLVFFMVSTIYMVHLNTLPVNLPAAQAARSETKPTVVSVTVNKAGHVFYDMDAKPTAGISENACGKAGDHIRHPRGQGYELCGYYKCA